jgi:hypothetical protein
MTTWIVSAGDRGRDYADYFFRFGVAFVGGDGQREYMKQVAVGDTILLKRGLSEFLAAGKVVERDGAVSGDDLTEAIRRIRLLADYYYFSGRWDDIREHETRTFLVVPLLLALGWAEQQLKIEFPVKGVGRVDIACFTGPFLQCEDDDVVVLIETKGFPFRLD